MRWTECRSANGLIWDIILEGLRKTTKILIWITSRHANIVRPSVTCNRSANHPTMMFDDEKYYFKVLSFCKNIKVNTWFIIRANFP
jgi:hypothetical protein